MKALISSLSNLRFRFAGIVAIALAPAGVLAIVQAIEETDAASERQVEIVEARALTTVDARRSTLVQVRDSIRLATIKLERELHETGGCTESLGALKTSSPWLGTAAVLDKGGHSICGEDAQIYMGDTTGWGSFTETSQYTLSAAKTGEVSGERVLFAYRAFNQPIGDSHAIGVSILVDYLSDISPLNLDDLQVDAKFTMIDRSGAAIGESEGDPGAWLPENRGSVQSFGDRKFVAKSADGHERLYFVSSISTGQLWAVTSPDLSSFSIFAFTLGSLSIIAPLLIWIIAVGVAYFSIDALVTRHVASLRRAAVRIGEGDLGTPVAGFEDAPSEIRALGVSVRAMRDKIAAREQELRTTLDLQHRLLLEVHHRVKNNLQTISSLINLEAGRVADPRDRRQLDTIQSRIHSLAMVHQNLYAAENLEEVALGQLTSDIAEHLEDSLGPDGQGSVILDRLDEVVAPTILATPIALFLSEALGNAFKHASHKPDIRIELVRSEETFSLTVSNAVPDKAADPAADAMPDQKNANKPAGLGFQLMKGFAKQISGAFTTETKAGRFVVTLQSPLPKATSLFSVRSAEDT